MDGPDSSFSCLLIHIYKKVDSEGKMEPPIYLVLVIKRSNYLDLHDAGRQSSDLLLHLFRHVWVHGGATRQKSLWMLMSLFMMELNIVLWLHRIPYQERRLEENLRARELLIANSEDLAIRQLVVLLQGERGCSNGHLLLKVYGNITQLLLDVKPDFPLSLVVKL